MNYRMIFILLLSVVLINVNAGWSTAADVPRMTKEELKDQLGSKGVVILDVRSDRDWATSEWKIQNAVREEPNTVEAWMSKYPKDKLLVLYCA